MIIESIKINFIHVPKAAGSSVGKYVRENIKLTQDDRDLQKEYAQYSKKHGYAFPNHTPAEVKKKFIGEDVYHEYFSFTFVRNPYSLLVSLYEYTHQKEKDIFEKNGWKLSRFQENILNNSFEDWVMNFETGRPQTDMICSSSGEILVNYIGKTEHFNLDFAKIQKIIGFNCDADEVANSTSHDDYKRYYSDKARRYIFSKYEKDFTMFGYNFENG